jgi:hypothetical protein
MSYITKRALLILREEGPIRLRPFTAMMDVKKPNTLDLLMRRKRMLLRLREQGLCDFVRDGMYWYVTDNGKSALNAVTHGARP